MAEFEAFEATLSLLSVPEVFVYSVS